MLNFASCPALTIWALHTMAATIHTAPPTLNYALDPIYTLIQSDLVANFPPKIDILISGSGPTVGDTFVIAWKGITINFTIVNADNENATGFRDMNGGESLNAYADAWAEYMRQNEQITSDWIVTRETDSGANRVVRLTYKTIERADVTADDTDLTNITLTPFDISGPTQVDNLRALVEVWEDTGDPGADRQLLKQHAPFDITTALARIDLSAAFADLEPCLPFPASINPSTLTNLYYEACERNWRKFYFRYAHKGGTPTQSDAMLKSDSSYFAILGSKASDSLTPNTFYRVLHNYRRRDGLVFRKPISCEQPDWIYWFSDNDGETVRASILVYWSDGTTSTYQPFATTIAPTLNICLKFGSGYRQNKLHLLSPPTGTAADATIVGYDWRLEQVDAPGSYWLTVRYEVYPLPTQFGIYLLMANGLGGCESVWLRGKVERSYSADREIFRRSRWPDGRTDAHVQRGDFSTFNQLGQGTIKCNTGWYADPYYLQHLQQIPLSDAWIIDLDNRRFIRVIAETKELITSRDDDTLFSMEITLRQATTDKAWNY